MSNPKRQYDIIIVGGGMVGSTAAITLARLGLSIALVEAIEPALSASPGFDQRAVALSASSVAIYRTLGLWPQLQSIACPIKHILVSDQGQFGFTRLHANDYDVEALGEVISLEETGPVLWRALAAEPGVEVFCPARVDSIKTSSQCCRVVLQETNDQDTKNQGSNNQEGEPVEYNSPLIHLEAQLLLAADGTYSTIAQQLGMNITRKPYTQHAVIANIATEIPHNNRAYERFTPGGPLALLPLSRNRMSLVWCHKPDSIEAVMQWCDEKFIDELQQAFGFRLGKIVKAGQRSQYPLSLHLAESPSCERVLLLGNAAHTLHPIAGQGFNLGLRDIAALSEEIKRAHDKGEDFGSTLCLTKFNQMRYADWQQTIMATDSLARLFSNEFLPLVLVRNKVMNLINHFPVVKGQLANVAMGFVGRSSRLARGLKEPAFNDTMDK